jgi:geranylgeranyl diphosphate synthase, type I
MDAPHARTHASPTPPAAAWLTHVQRRVDHGVARLLDLPDEAALDPRWGGALDEARAFALRPAKRLRPALLMLGYGLARGDEPAPAGVWRFAASVELLHTFLLIHDDVADAADTRRGGAALHHRLGGGRRGDDLAVVVGDHLFARAVEGMLASRVPRAADVLRYYLGVCRLTAVGQFLDLAQSRSALGDVTLFQTLKVALLKTARYGFVAPLVGGALLGGAERTLAASLERVGRQMGIAFQLRDDLLGLFGTAERTGKPTADLAIGKPTFPVVAAYVRAPAPARRELDAAWAAAADDAGARGRMLELVEQHGGRAAAERAVDRASRAARRTLRGLPTASACRTLLDEMIANLADRTA